MNVILSCVKFRRACKQLQALETPGWLEVVNSLRELDESVFRLTRLFEGDYENRKGNAGGYDVERDTYFSVLGTEYRAV